MGARAVGEQVLGLDQRGEAGGVPVDADARVGDLVGGVHPAGEHGQDGVDDGVPAGHQGRFGAPAGGGRAEVQLRVGGEGRGEELAVLQVLAEGEPVEGVGDLGAVAQFGDDGGGVAGLRGQGLQGGVVMMSSAGWGSSGPTPSTLPP